MQDRELLERAAKAAGIDATWRPNVAEGGEWLAVPLNDGCDSWTEWNPLTDDGDALRLAVKLRIKVTPATDSEYALAKADGQEIGAAESCIFDGDPFIATRRAIVRAAAALGEGME